MKLRKAMVNKWRQGKRKVHKKPFGGRSRALSDPLGEPTALSE